MAGVALHVSFCNLERTISNTFLFSSDKAEVECGGIAKRIETVGFIVLFFLDIFFPFLLEI